MLEKGTHVSCLLHPKRYIVEIVWKLNEYVLLKLDKKMTAIIDVYLQEGNESVLVYSL